MRWPRKRSPRGWPACSPPRSRSPPPRARPPSPAGWIRRSATRSSSSPRTASSCCAADPAPARAAPSRPWSSWRRPATSGSRPPPPRHKRIALAAPTGRAAKRLEELTGHDARTLHRLLGAQAPASGGGWTGTPEFLHGESWPLDAEIVVVDESSMLDVELAAALVEACADGTHLLLVGDPAQLPSIGPGRVLADVLESGAVPSVELTTLHRQAEGGTIARLAAAVRGGELPRV